MVETSKIGCCIIKEKAKPQKSWSFSSHKCVLCICIFIQTLQYVLCASGTSSWAYPSCTDLCCINNSLALSPANLNLLVFSSYLYLLCHMPLNLTAVVLPLLSQLWDFLSEGWVLNYFGVEGELRECSSLFWCSPFTHRIALTFSSSLLCPYFWGA